MRFRRKMPAVLMMALVASALTATGSLAQKTMDLSGPDDPIPFNPSGFEPGTVIGTALSLDHDVQDGTGRVIGKVIGEAPEGHGGSDRLYIFQTVPDAPLGRASSVVTPANFGPGNGALRITGTSVTRALSE